VSSEHAQTPYSRPVGDEHERATAFPNSPKSLELIKTEVQEILERHCAGSRRVEGLDVGCGRRSQLTLPDQVHLVGIDVSSTELDLNEAVNEKIVGDVEVVPLPAERFDLIISWNTIEHLSRPDETLEKLEASLKHGGLMVLAAPNVLSLKGLVTKYTPHWFHRWIYRRFMPFMTYDPFRTYLRLSIAPRSVTEWAARSGFTILYSARYEAFLQSRIRERLRVHGKWWAAIRQVTSWLSLGKIEAETTDYVLVLRKSAADTSAAAATGDEPGA
jgi:2-polyprenyl-3-methyl-5-hydroxy-6-metoxy-1,4-benzoquinol methylase